MKRILIASAVLALASGAAFAAEGDYTRKPAQFDSGDRGTASADVNPGIDFGMTSSVDSSRGSNDADVDVGQILMNSNIYSGR